MKILTRITKLELNNLFFSPLAWLAMVVFTIFIGSNIVSQIESNTLYQGLYGRESFRSLAELIFTFGPSSLYRELTTLIIVLVPLIAMGVISRESSTGTIKMLYSSPIKLRDIVLGKFAAVLVFVTLLMGIVILGIYTASISIESLDVARLLSGFLGLYLLALLIAAVTVYISTFSSYPVIDVLGTIAIVYGIGLLYSQVKEIPGVSELVYWLSPTQQLSNIYGGLILSKTILYFITLIVLFLVWAYFKMRLKRQTIKGKRSIRVKMFAALVVALATIYVSSKPENQWYKDISDNKSNVLSSFSKDKLASLKEGPITITTYVDVLSNGIYGLKPSQQLFDKNNFYRYQLEFPQITFKYVYFYDPTLLDEYFRLTGKAKTSLEDALYAICENNHLNQEELITADALPKEVLKQRVHRTNLPLGVASNKSFRIIEANNKKALMEVSYEDRAPIGEKEYTRAFLQLIGPLKTLGFVTGHNEIDPYDFNAKGLRGTFTGDAYRNGFVNNGYEIVTINLNTAIPTSVDALVIANPKLAFTAAELTNLENYVKGGNDLMVFSEPGFQDVVNPVIASLGITQKAGLVVHDNPEFKADYHAIAIRDDIALDEATFMQYVQMPTAAALQIDTLPQGFTVDTWFKTDATQTWIDQEGLNEIGDVAYNPEEGEQKAAYPLAVLLERHINDNVQKILVSGDTDFLSNDRKRFAPMQIRVSGSLQITSILVNTFSDGKYPLKIQVPEAKDKRTKIAYESVPYLKLVWYLILPGIFIFFGVRMLRKRMKK